MNSALFSTCGNMFSLSFFKRHEMTSVDQVDFSPPNLDHMHVTISQPSISLMKSHTRKITEQLYESWSDRWPCKDAPMKNRWWKSRRTWVEWWERVHSLRTTWTHRDHPKFLQRIGQCGFFAMKSQYINVLSS